MGGFHRFLRRLTESDETRLESEIREWAEKVPGSVRIADAPLRQRVKIAGVIRRLTVFPMKDNESLEAVVSDGTGEVVSTTHAAGAAIASAHVTPQPQ